MQQMFRINGFHFPQPIQRRSYRKFYSQQQDLHSLPQRIVVLLSRQDIAPTTSVLLDIRNDRYTDLVPFVLTRSYDREVARVLVLEALCVESGCNV
jgi:hypothetical protein